MNASHVPAKGLHPFEGFATEITHKLFSLSVNRLVSIQSARRDKSLSAYVTPVRPLPCVSPDMCCKVGAIAETLLTNRATIRLLFILLAVVVVGMER